MVQVIDQVDQERNTTTSPSPDPTCSPMLPSSQLSYPSLQCKGTRHTRPSRPSSVRKTPSDHREGNLREHRQRPVDPRWYGQNYRAYRRNTGGKCTHQTHTPTLRLTTRKASLQQQSGTNGGWRYGDRQILRSTSRLEYAAYLCHKVGDVFFRAIVIFIGVDQVLICPPVWSRAAGPGRRLVRVQPQRDLPS